MTKQLPETLYPGSTVTLYVRHEGAARDFRAMIKDGYIEVSGFTSVPRPLRVGDRVLTPAGYGGVIKAIHGTYAWVSGLRDRPVTLDLRALRHVDGDSAADTLATPAGEHHGA